MARWLIGSSEPFVLRQFLIFPAGPRRSTAEPAGLQSDLWKSYCPPRFGGRATSSTGEGNADRVLRAPKNNEYYSKLTGPCRK